VIGISMLAESGWRGDRVLRMTVERMNGLNNAPRASGPTPTRIPDYREFQEAVRLIHKLAGEELLAFEFGTRIEEISEPIAADNVEGDMLIDAAKTGLEFRACDEGRKMVLTQEERILMMRVAAAAADSADVNRLRTLLCLDPGRMRYDLVEQADADYDPLAPGAMLSNISIDTRSLMGVMYYLSNAVDVPPEDIVAGPVTETVDEEGNVFDWGDLLDGMFRVYMSKSPPAGAAVSVRHRGNWFYIADDDESSLSTFALLNQLSSLTAGEIQRTAPVLTLPVGG
jgi:hypothetical protein